MSKDNQHLWTLGLTAAATLAIGYLIGRKTAPIPHAKPNPTLLRRTVLCVSDVEESLKLYRDCLGLEVVFDKTIDAGGRTTPTDSYDIKLRLV